MPTTKTVVTKKYYGALIALVAFANIILIFNNNVWCDEAFILNACRLETFKELFHYITFEDMRPPFYLFCAKIFTSIFGVSVPVLKIFSIIPAILTMLLGAVEVHRNWGHGKVIAGTVFILLVGLSPMGLTKNIEITIYSWVLFFVTCSAIYAYNTYMNPASKKNWCILILSSLGAAATHYYGVLSGILIYGFLFCFLLRQDFHLIKKCIFACIITVVGYLPILPFFYYQFSTARKSFWILDTSLFTLLQSMRAPFEGENRFCFSHEFTMFFWIFIIGAFIYEIISVVKRILLKEMPCPADIFCILCGCGFILFLSAGFILSKLIRPLYIDRYIYVMVGILWLFIAISVEHLVTDFRQTCFCIGAIVCMFVFAYPAIWEREYNKATEDTVAFFQENLSEDDIFINNIELCTNWVLNYYFPAHPAYLNCDLDIYYRDSSYDFSDLNTTAWYLCSGDLDIPQEILEDNQLQCEWVYNAELDHYYYFAVYKITPTGSHP